MATSSRTEHVRFRYGMCLNDSCPKCKEKEVQQIGARKDFVCAECGKALRECPPPAQGGKWKLYAGIAAAVVVLGGGAAVLFSGGDDKPAAQPATPADTVQVADTVKAEGPVPVATEEPKPEAPKAKAAPQPAKPAAESQPKNGYGTVNLGYGTYRGDLKNGQPHGHGTITYKQAHKIVSSKDFTANPGDTYEGEFRDGRISGGIGYWRHDGDITAVQP